MSNKYAMIWTTDIGYMPGTNATLNALEYYGFTDLDVYIMFWGEHKTGLTDEYRNSFPNVTWIDITSFWPKQMNAYWYLVFADIYFTINNLGDYKSVMFWGGDSCILNNFQEWFEVSEKLDRIVIGSNEQGNQSYAAMSKAQPYGHTWDVPYADMPVFVPPSKFDFLRKTLEFQGIEGARVDRMDGMNYAIRDLGYEPIVLPGCFWVFNVPGKILLNDNGKHVFLLNHKMNSFHRKYWIKNYGIMYAGENLISLQNIKMFNRKYNFFNKNCRVKWEIGVDSFD